MLVRLKELKPNPLRDFAIDPLEDDRVELLRVSIKDDGFWGGVVCRERDDHIEVAAGWHRVQAALKAGHKEADVFVADAMDDGTMVRIYARENATQRGNSSPAKAGAVASAVRILAKTLMTGDLRQIGQRFTKRAIETAAGTLEKGEGIGRDLVLELLDGIPGMTDHVIRDQLAALKGSGTYTRLLEEVKAEIEVEHRDRLEKLAKAEKAAEEARARAEKAEAERKAAAARAKQTREDSERKIAEAAQERAELAEAAQRKAREELAAFKTTQTMRDRSAQAVETAQERHAVVFDLDVQKILPNESHGEMFRQLATSQAYRDYAPVKRQVAIAKDIVRVAKSLDAELTAAFIKQHFHDIARQGGEMVSRRLREAKEGARLRADEVQQYRTCVAEFERGCRIMIAAGQKLIELERRWPNGVAKPLGGGFIQTLKLAQKVINRAADTFI